MSHDKPSMHEALDALGDGTGTVSFDIEGGRSDVDVVDVDRLGVRVKGVSVHRERAVDVEREATELPERLRALPDTIEPVEVDSSLGGARLRTRPERMRNREYFEVDVAPKRTDIRRTRVNADGDREAAEWTLTRDQLERLVEQTKG